MSKRVLKADLEREIRHLRKLVRIGGLMSNLCYNVKHMEGAPDRVREDAAHCQRDWDQASLEAEEAEADRR